MADPPAAPVTPRSAVAAPRVCCLHFAAAGFHSAACPAATDRDRALIYDQQPRVLAEGAIGALTEAGATVIVLVDVWACYDRLYTWLAARGLTQRPETEGWRCGRASGR